MPRKTTSRISYELMERKYKKKDGSRLYLAVIHWYVDEFGVRRKKGKYLGSVTEKDIRVQLIRERNVIQNQLLKLCEVDAVRTGLIKKVLKKDLPTYH